MWLRDRINWLLKSFENNADGASSRKLSVFVVMACIVYTHIKFVDKDNAVSALIVDFAFCLMVYNLLSENGLINIFGSRPLKQGTRETTETTVDGTTGTTKETITKDEN